MYIYMYIYVETYKCIYEDLKTYTYVYVDANICYTYCLQKLVLTHQVSDIRDLCFPGGITYDAIITHPRDTLLEPLALKKSPRPQNL